MAKIQFDNDSGTELIRAAFFQRLKQEKTWNTFQMGRDNLSGYIEYVGDSILMRQRAEMLAQDVFWELVIQGVLAPGYNAANPNLPHFHRTEYGEKVLAEEKFVPHDPDGFLQQFKSEHPNADATVIAYLAESLDCFARGNHIACVMMLGISAERVFLRLCGQLLSALANQSEQRKFQEIIERMALKPKLDFVSAKILEIRSKRPRDLPDDVNIMISVIYNFIRRQRNDIGHPKETPPEVSRNDAFVNLRLFPTYYGMVEEIIHYLGNNMAIKVNAFLITLCLLFTVEAEALTQIPPARRLGPLGLCSCLLGLN